jgi:predicted secreted protein
VLIGCQRDSSLESQFETIDATCKDNDGAKATLPGQLSWSVSMDAVQVFDATKGVKQLMTSHLAKQSVYVAWTTGIEADPIFTGNAYITQLTQNGPLNDTATYSVTFTGDGPMTQSVVAAGGYPD